MFLVPLLVIILFVWVIAFVLRSSGSSNTGASNSTAPLNKASNDKALNILNERYARGEITEDEYLRIKRNLK